MAPSLRFRGQPFRDEDTAGAFLAGALADVGIESLTIVVAWARFGGLARFRADLEAFRARGGTVRIIVGIDEGGATLPGLSEAIRVASEPFVFHDRQARTFHPKLYLAEGPETARLLVGSSNMTAGGLFSNYEASLEAEFELPAEEDAEALSGAKDYVRMLIEDEELCLLLDEALLDQLVADPRYAISRQERRQRRSSEPLLEGIFSPSRHKKVSARALPSDAQAELGEIEAEAETGVPTAVETWTKLLRPSDAQHPPSPGSNPLGNLRLTKAKHDIPWLTWFRRDMFGPASWSRDSDRNGNSIDVASVPFDVTIDGEWLGTIELRVDHAPHRESGQSNHATVLHWGDLSPVLRATDYTGYTLTIQRMSDDAYRLDISR